MGDRQMQHDASADRAAKRHRLLQVERLGKSADGLGVAKCGEAVLLLVPSFGRTRLAVPRQVEGQHAEVRGDRRIGHQVAELPSVGAGCVEAEERDPLSRVLEVHAVLFAAERQMHVAADDGIDLGGHLSALPRAGGVPPTRP
jgi:hypothetical protein